MAEIKQNVFIVNCAFKSSLGLCFCLLSFTDINSIIREKGWILWIQLLYDQYWGQIENIRNRMMRSLSPISQRPGFHLTPDITSIAYIHPRALKLPFCVRRQNSQEDFRKCICKDTEVLSRSKPLILKRPPPFFYPLGSGINVIEDHY